MAAQSRQLGGIILNVIKAAAVILGSEPQIQSENTVVNANDSRTTASLGARSRYRLVLIPYRLTLTVLFHFSVTQSQRLELILI